jgi:hypothetical protein
LTDLTHASSAIGFTPDRTHASGATDYTHVASAADRTHVASAADRTHDRTPFVKGGREPLVEFHGAELTPAEIAAAKELFGKALEPYETFAELAERAAKGVTYRSKAYVARMAHHIGQRKLLMGEVEFIDECARAGDTIVYAGAAPGTHLLQLIELFADRYGPKKSDQLKFHLVDPRPCNSKVVKMPGVTASVELFTDELALSYKGRDDVLFISDIRTGVDTFELPSEETIETNMAEQKRWVELMAPRAALLKFRLKYGSTDKTPYLAGDVRLQAWAPSSSTETRLLVRRNSSGGFDTAEYDAGAYDNLMYYLNSIAREWGTFKHALDHMLPAVEGLDRCYDCAREVGIWQRFVRRRGEADGARANTQIAELVKQTSAIVRSLLDNQHGESPGKPMPERRVLAIKHAPIHAEQAVKRRLDFVKQGERQHRQRKHHN